MSRPVVRPYLLTKGEDGLYRVTVRTTRFNSQGYPLVKSEQLTEDFPTAARARSYLRAEFRAEAIDIASK